MIESLASGDHTGPRARAGRACALASGAGGRSGTVAGKRKSKGTGRKQTRAARFGGLAEDAVRGAEDAEDEAVERTGQGVAGGDGRARPGGRGRRPRTCVGRRHPVPRSRGGYGSYFNKIKSITASTLAVRCVQTLALV